MKIEKIKFEELDLNGSGQVNHTHANMTIIVEKLNEVIDQLNSHD